MSSFDVIVPGAEGLVVVCGSSGHGFKIGPAIGQSRLLQPFSLARF